MNHEIQYSETNLVWMSGVHRFTHSAMATTFEIFILHPDVVYAKQAAYATFDDLDRLERLLSRFIESSDISRINHLPANVPTRVGLETFECLNQCQTLYEETQGAFDVTIGALLSCWMNPDHSPRTPTDEQLQFARQHTGMHRLQLDRERHTVLRKTEFLQLDLGGFGKGFALDKMEELLRDWEIDIALLHGGWSTVLALDPPPSMEGWPVTISDPTSEEILRHINLQNEALSGSGLRKGQHIIDPRTARPAQGPKAAWAQAPIASTADALSTAFMIMSPEEIECYSKKHPKEVGIVL